MACSIMANQRSSARSRCFLKSARRIMTVISFSNRLTVLYFTAFSSKRNLEITQIAQITYAVFMHIILHRFSCHNIHICTQNISRQYISHMHRCIGCDGVEQCHAVEYFLFSQRTICFHRQARQVCPLDPDSGGHRANRVLQFVSSVLRTSRTAVAGNSEALFLIHPKVAALRTGNAYQFSHARSSSTLTVMLPPAAYEAA